jgi:APA family basic amino acid/polyamine antiporter
VTLPPRRALGRVLGPVTTFLVGLGVAIGSGILRTPGLVASATDAPALILAAWAAGGLFVLASGLVSAELATRFPEAGGEYVYLREAYGRFPAFFFGWAYTIFIIGGGAATIAAAAGESLQELLGLQASSARPLAALAIVGVTAVNALGVGAGAALQNALTALKLAALLGLAAAALLLGESGTHWAAPPPASAQGWWLLLGALPPVLWSYDGTTDAAKLAEEVEDVQRALPRALVGAALALTLLYLLVNAAYLAVLTPAELARGRFAANEVMARLFGPLGGRLMNALGLVVFLGCLSSTLLATVRVTFALARDGLAFGALARMSRGQSPVAALALVGAIALVFTWGRGFSEILSIYFLAAALLFGLAYGSLFVFRRREARLGLRPPAGVFVAPMGRALAAGLIAVQLAMAVHIAVSDPRASLGTAGLLALCALAYLIPKGARRGSDGAGR